MWRGVGEHPHSYQEGQVMSRALPILRELHCAMSPDAVSFLTEHSCENPSKLILLTLSFQNP